MTAASLIDTNVLVTANKPPSASLKCVTACAEALTEAKNGLVVLDNQFRIINEYRKNVNAVDTDWWLFREPLERHGIKIDFLCTEMMVAKGDKAR